jgi:hypothetical protein
LDFRDVGGGDGVLGPAEEGADLGHPALGLGLDGRFLVGLVAVLRRGWGRDRCQLLGDLGQRRPALGRLQGVGVFLAFLAGFGDLVRRRDVVAQLRELGDPLVELLDERRPADMLGDRGEALVAALALDDHVAHGLVAGRPLQVEELVGSRPWCLGVGAMFGGLGVWLGLWLGLGLPAGPGGRRHLALPVRRLGESRRARHLP